MNPKPCPDALSSHPLVHTSWIHTPWFTPHLGSTSIATVKSSMAPERCRRGRNGGFEDVKTPAKCGEGSVPLNEEGLPLSPTHLPPPSPYPPPLGPPSPSPLPLRLLSPPSPPSPPLTLQVPLECAGCAPGDESTQLPGAAGHHLGGGGRLLKLGRQNPDPPRR